VIKTLGTLQGNITVICNNYSDKDFSFVKELYPEVNFIRGDNTKGCSEKLKYIGQGNSEYIAMCDDDLLYPRDYFTRLPEKEIFSYHGSVLKSGRITNYYKDRKVYYCLYEVHSDVNVDIIGSGVCIFRRDLFSDVDKLYNYVKHPNMTDIYLSYFARLKGIKRVVLKHERGWIKSQGVKDSIHASHKNNCEQQTMFINKIWNGYGYV